MSRFSPRRWASRRWWRSAPSVLDIAEGTWLVLDAEQGNLATAPDQTALAAAEQTLAARQQRKQVERAAAHADCRTADGVRIEVFANLGSLAEAQVAMAHGAEGCGLLRTEFLFLERDAPPDEDEQLQQYQGIATTLAGRPLVIRTLDIGGDKPIPYLPMPAEAESRARPARRAHEPVASRSAARAVARDPASAARGSMSRAVADDHGHRRDPGRASHDR